MPAVPFKVKAVYEYKSEEPDDLNFSNGQIITVTQEEDDDWYTGEYMNVTGEKIEGIFPKNFVEKYEPAIPSRPVRAPKRAPAPEPSEQMPESPTPQPVPPPVEPSDAGQEKANEENAGEAEVARVEGEAPPPAPKPQPSAPASTSTPSAPAAKSPPPVIEKPTSNSFRDRIAAFNKPAAAPVAPFKPGGGPSTGFIKKPFVAPPPRPDAFIPPPRQPPQKVFRREEDSSLNEPESQESVEALAQQPEAEAEDQPKPQSLKERIALLQKQQQLEAQRNAEKKEKPKKPPKKRIENTESSEQVPASQPRLARLDSNETVGRPSAELAEVDREMPPLPRRTTTGLGTPQVPSRELVSDTNDADDSGAADDEDNRETSTEEERPKSKGTDMPTPGVPSRKLTEVRHEAESENDEGEEEEGEEEEEDEDEDPDVRRRRELRERMAKMSGGMGMMGMFGPTGGGGLPGAGRKSKPSADASRQTSESHVREEPEERVAPVRIMALPGMSPSVPKRQEEPVASTESDEEDTAQPTPQVPGPSAETDDYISQPLPRRSTDRAAPPVPQGNE